MNLKRILIAIGAVGFLSGCTTNYPRLTEPNEQYLKALQDTESQIPDDADKAVRGIMELFEDYSYDNLKQNVRKVYAEKFYFRDGFKLLTHIDDLEPYMLHSTEPLRSCTFTFEPAVYNAPDYYLHWTMHANLKSEKEDHIESVIGMSRVRFNKEGKVTFQQDYWDPTDILYRKIPIANGLIGYVRSKL